MSENLVQWFENELNERTRCIGCGTFLAEGSSRTKNSNRRRTSEPERDVRLGIVVNIAPQSLG